MKTLTFPLLLALIFVNFVPETFALNARGNLQYSATMYENDLEIASPYRLKSNESFLAACNASDERIPTFSRITRDHLIVFSSLLWNRRFSCHISVIDNNRRGRVIVSSGSFTVQTPGYYLP